jgi:hypothetical protein
MERESESGRFEARVHFPNIEPSATPELRQAEKALKNGFAGCVENDDSS